MQHLSRRAVGWKHTRVGPLSATCASIDYMMAEGRQGSHKARVLSDVWSEKGIVGKASVGKNLGRRFLW